MNKAVQITFAVMLVAVLAMLARQQQQIQTLTMALADKPKLEMLASQARCSEMASKFLSNRHYESTGAFEYKNHYNGKLN